MLWKDREESGNVEDRRSLGKTGLAVGGIGTLLLLLVGWYFGIDVRPLLNPQGGGGAPDAQVDPAQDELKHFVAVVLKDTEDVWNERFQTVYHKRYREPKLVLFSGQVDSACGLADSAVGPFYCPGDEHVYLDLTFFGELKNRFGAPGEFAEAYVIAHEIGHHVQKQLGYEAKVRTRKGRMSDSVRLELQADYLAGVWAYHAQRTKHILEHGDIEAALTAANAIGDDTLQKRGRGRVMPDSFTHGTSAQRVRAFSSGFKSGDCTREKLDVFFTADEL